MVKGEQLLCLLLQRASSIHNIQPYDNLCLPRIIVEIFCIEALNLTFAVGMKWREVLSLFPFCDRINSAIMLLACFAGSLIADDLIIVKPLVCNGINGYTFMMTALLLLMSVPDHT